MKHILLITLLLSSFYTLAQRRKPSKTLKHQEGIQVLPLFQLNSKYRETNLCLSADHKLLLFMSGRKSINSKESYTIYKGRPEYDGDIYLSFKANKVWKAPLLMQNISSTSGEDEPNISLDGLNFYIQSWTKGWAKFGGPYYKISKTKDGKTKIEGLRGGITTFFKRRSQRAVLRYTNDYSTDGSTISPDGKTFIVAVGVYDGDMDLFISKKNAKGRWGRLKRMKISTPGDERTPKIAIDGKTLYFSSNGFKGGFGGLDIYKTALNPDGTTGEVINVGSPFNSKKDDMGLCLDLVDNKALLVRDSDIYTADLTKANPAIKPASVIRFHGYIAEAKNFKKLDQAKVILREVDTQKVVSVSYTNFKGYFVDIVPFLSKNVELVIEKNGYQSKVISIADIKTQHYQEIKKRIVLDKR